MIATRARVVIVAPLLLLALAGCSSTVPMQAADDAANPDCANIIVALRDLDVIDDNVKRPTDAQATAAWGEPAVILLTCGVPVPAPSTQRCVTVDGIDWLIDDSDPDAGVFTTYGRDPAVQVVVGSETSDSGALYALADAVSANAPQRACTAPEDAVIDDTVD